MGRAQGEALRDEIVAVEDRMLASEAFALARPSLLPARAAAGLMAWRAKRRMARALAARYPEHAARLRGIAAGGGVRERRLYLALGAEVLLNRVAWVTGGCTAVALEPARTSFGEAAIAKNFDFPEDFRGGYFVRRSEPADGLRSIEVTIAPLSGCHSGVNEAGLAVTYNYGHALERPREPLPVMLLCQRLLERCRSVTEAIGACRQAPRASGALLALADATGAVAVLEMSPWRFAVRRAREGAACCTNHFETPEVAPVDVPHDARHSMRSVAALAGRRVHESSEARGVRLERAIGRDHALSLREIEALLRDHKDGKNDLSICRHGDYYRTTCSVVLFPKTRRLRVLFGAPCEGAFDEHAIELAPRRPAARTP